VFFFVEGRCRVNLPCFVSDRAGGTVRVPNSGLWLCGQGGLLYSRVVVTL